MGAVTDTPSDQTPSNTPSTGALAAPDRIMARRGWFILLVGVVAIAPMFFASNYRLFQLTTVAIYALAVLGLNIATGYNGQLSLGHGAFYAIGAYVTAILMSDYDVPYWLTLPPAALASGVIGFLFGFPALRLGPLYLGLTTFSLAVALPQLLKYQGLQDWTGGVQGITLSKPDAPFGLGLNPDQWFYLFTLLVVTALFLASFNLLRGRIGRGMRAIRDHAVAAEAMGINIALLKTRTFAVSAMLTGIAGSLGAIVVEFVSPDSFSVALSLALFVGLVAGGVASITGALFGAAFVVFVPNLSELVSKAAPGAVYGVILILFLYLLPGGVAGLFAAIGRRLARRGRTPTTP